MHKACAWRLLCGGAASLDVYKQCACVHEAALLSSSAGRRVVADTSAADSAVHKYLRTDARRDLVSPPPGPLPPIHSIL
jgi:hypothetical protein